VERIRVLLGNHPMMVPDALRQMITNQDDMELVGDVRGPMKILQEIGRTKADAIVLVQEANEEPGLCSQLLAVYPDLTVIGVSSDMTRVFTQQLCSHRKMMTIGEELDIVQTMRIAVRQPCSE
jgi:DNA-binding NarL/FixJ family response regulator